MQTSTKKEYVVRVAVERAAVAEWRAGLAELPVQVHLQPTASVTDAYSQMTPVTVAYSRMTIRYIESKVTDERYCAYHTCFHPQDEFSTEQRMSRSTQRYCNAFADADMRAHAEPSMRLPHGEVYRMAERMCVRILIDHAPSWDGHVNAKEQRMNDETFPAVWQT